MYIYFMLLLNKYYISVIVKKIIKNFKNSYEMPKRRRFKGLLEP